MTGKVGDPGKVMTPRLSPDGSRVAFQKFAANVFDSDVWLLDLKQNSSTRFTFGPASSAVSCVVSRWQRDRILFEP